MKKQQVYIISGGIVLLIALAVFGKTVNPAKEKVEPVAESTITKFNFEEVLNNSKKSLDSNLQIKLAELETLNDKASQQDKVHTLTQLALFWRDTANLIEPYLFYTAKAAKLVNSEKTLTFAAHQFIDKLLVVDNATLQNWLASEAKVLFDKALTINPNNDSSKIGLGACYILGNISNNPMVGILPVREISIKQPNNLFAHYILGLGGIKSTQFAKAIEHFKVLANADPENVVYTLHLAECYERMKEKESAIEWYNKSKELIKDDKIKKEIDSRIKEIGNP